MVTSKESLENLCLMAGKDNHPHLMQTPVLLGSDSMLGTHARLGFTAPAVVASSPLDDDMLAALMRWHNAHVKPEPCRGANCT